MHHKGLVQRRGRKRFARPCPCTVTIGSRSHRRRRGRALPFARRGQGSFIRLGSCQSYPKARSNWFGTALAFLYFLFHRRSGFLLGFGAYDSKAIDWLDSTENGGQEVRVRSGREGVDQSRDRGAFSGPTLHLYLVVMVTALQLAGFGFKGFGSASSESSGCGISRPIGPFPEPLIGRDPKRRQRARGKGQN